MAAKKNSPKPNALDMFKNIKPVEKKPVKKQEGITERPYDPQVSDKDTENTGTDVKEDSTVNEIQINTAGTDNQNKAGTSGEPVADTGEKPESSVSVQTDAEIKPDEKDFETSSGKDAERELTVYHIDSSDAVRLDAVKMLDEEFLKLKLYSLKNGIPKYEVFHSIIQSEMAYDRRTGFPDDEFIVRHAMETVKNKVSRQRKCAFRLPEDDIEFVSKMSAECAMTKQEYYIFLFNEYIK